jgi:hypothetical protein
MHGGLNGLRDEMHAGVKAMRDRQDADPCPVFGALIGAFTGSSARNIDAGPSTALHPGLPWWRT